MLLLILAILSNLYKPTKVDINQILPPLELMNIQPSMDSTLALPPINFEREVVTVKKRRYAIAYDRKEVLIRADTVPEFPFIIRGPGESGYWVQILPGEKWISLKSAEDKIKTFKSLLSGGDPPITPREGNGNGEDEGPHRPFKVGDIVQVVAHPELGYGKVTAVEYFQNGDEWWLVSAKFYWEEGVTVYSAKPSKFKKIEELPKPEEKALDPQDDKTPSYPIIVNPKPNEYWIKIKLDHPWVSVEAIGGDTGLLAEVIKKAMGEPPHPPGGPGEHNGDSPLWYDPPFKRGDLVTYLGYPIVGKMMVADLWLKMLPESKKLVWMVEAVYKIPPDTQYKHLKDFSANFKKVEEE